MTFEYHKTYVIKTISSLKKVGNGKLDLFCFLYDLIRMCGFCGGGEIKGSREDREKNGGADIIAGRREENMSM